MMAPTVTRSGPPPRLAADRRVRAVARQLARDARIGLVIGVGMVVVYMPRADAAAGGMALTAFMHLLANVFCGWAASGFIIVLLHRLASRVLAGFTARLAFVVTTSVLLRLLAPLPVQQLGLEAHMLDLSASSQALLLELTWTTVLCAAITTIYLDRAATRRAVAQRLADLQRQQQRARRELVEARLRVLQARIDPQLFFDMLGEVRERYASDPPAAEALLDRLTVFLRAALPRVRTAMSTVQQEVDLAAAYADMLNAAGVSRTTLSVTIDPAAGGVAFPAGVVLPLLEALFGRVDDAPGAVELEAARAPQALRLRLQGSRGTPAPRLERVRETLAAVYGDQAVVNERLGLGGAWVIDVEVRELAAGAGHEEREAEAGNA